MFDNLTAEQLLSFDFGGMGDSKVLLINLVAFLAGVVLNTFREMKKEGIGFMDYWTNHGFSSMASMGTLVATFLTMMALTPTAPVYAYFSMAFVGDAVVNQAPVNAAKERQRGLGSSITGIADEIVELHKQHPVKVIGIATAFLLVLLLVI